MNPDFIISEKHTAAGSVYIVLPTHISALNWLFARVNATERRQMSAHLGSGPWPATNVQRELLRILLYHSGAQRAISLHALIVKLDRVVKPIPTEREIKDAIRSLVVNFKVRIGASRSKPFGYFLIATAAEARDAAHLYISEIRELARRVRVLLDPHDLSELEGQSWLKQLVDESDPDPKEAA